MEGKEQACAHVKREECEGEEKEAPAATQLLFSFLPPNQYAN